MASTRDINSKGNYILEQQQLNNTRNNLTYYNGPNGHAANPAFPESYMQGYMPPDNFSFNPTDIESALFGIGSTNLVEPKEPTAPQFKVLPTVSFYKKPDVVKAPILFPLLNQRPFIF